MEHSAVPWSHGLHLPVISKNPNSGPTNNGSNWMGEIYGFPQKESWGWKKAYAKHIQETSMYICQRKLDWEGKTAWRGMGNPKKRCAFTTVFSVSLPWCWRQWLAQPYLEDQSAPRRCKACSAGHWQTWCTPNKTLSIKAIISLPESHPTAPTGNMTVSH